MLGNMELMLQATPRVYAVDGNVSETTQTIYLQATANKPLMVVCAYFFHSAAGALNSTITIQDGSRTFTVRPSTAQNPGTANAIWLYSSSFPMASYPLLLVYSGTTGKFLRIKYTVVGLNGSDEDCSIRAVVYEFTGFPNIV